MAVHSINTAVAVTATLCFLFSACQKEVVTADEATNPLASKAAQATVNSDKQERKILFVSNRDGNDEVYAMSPDGSHVVRLTYNNWPDGRATWSANGQHIAFASGQPNNRDIYVMNANGQGLRNLTNTPNVDEEWPEWSPKDNSIIFSSNRTGNFEVYVTDMEGEEVKQLTFRPQADLWPTFSPDGMKIAFQSDLGITAGRTDVFTMNQDGSGVQRLTSSPGLDQMPTWSPDGARIAFMSNRGGSPDVYVMNADGSDQKLLVGTPAVEARPSWSREGYGLVFAGTRDFPLPSALFQFEIYLINSDGTGLRRLTNNTVYDDYPFIR